MWSLSFIVSILIQCILCDAYSLLVVFPLPGKSHAILGNAFVEHLLSAGHKVTYITPMPIKNSNPQLRQINVESNFKQLPSDDILDIQKLMSGEVNLKVSATLFSLMYNIANATLFHDNVQKLLHDPGVSFDAVITEWMYSDLYAGFSVVYGCPQIWFLSVNAHTLALSLIDQDLNPAYVADHIKSNLVPPFTFWQRVDELQIFLNRNFYRWSVNDLNEKTFEEAFKPAVVERGGVFTSLDVVKYNVSLMFGNCHVSTGDAIPLPRNFVEIAGYHVPDKVDQLPKNLQSILDNATHGAIYFSMGSMLKSSKMPSELKAGIMKTFSELKQTVIWKFEEKLSNLPKNVHIVDWAPQQSILAHRNCVLFITHGGLLSTIEALHFGVPLIGIPMFGEQPFNVNRAVAKGFAKRVDLNHNTPGNLKAAIKEMLSGVRYQERMKEMSFVFHDRAISPGAEIPRWIHHVIKTRGALHLRSPALSTSWYQKVYLDLVALILLVISTIFVLIGLLKRKKDNISTKQKYKHS